MLFLRQSSQITQKLRQLVSCRYFSQNVELTPKLIRSKILSQSKLPQPFKPTLREGQYKVLPHQPIPAHIKRPNYAYRKDGRPPSSAQLQVPFAEIKTKDEIQLMRNAGKLAAQCLRFAYSLSKRGVSTDEIDKEVHNFIIENGAYPSAVNFHRFPKSMCSSPNEVACHGLPDTRPLQEGDIISYDCTLFLEGVHGDCAGTIGIGQIQPELQKLLDVAYESLMNGISVVKPDVCISEIGKMIEKTVAPSGFSIIKEFCGHFIGKDIHMPPLVPHISQNHTTINLKPGHVFTIEPVICQGTAGLNTWEDTWTIVTNDNGKCAQFEHTVLVTEDGFVRFSYI